jgi:hypothetical protein
MKIIVTMAITTQQDGTMQMRILRVSTTESVEGAEEYAERWEQARTEGST